MNDASAVIERSLVPLIAPDWTVRVLHSQSGGGPTALDIVLPTGSTRRLTVRVITGETTEVHQLVAFSNPRDVLVVAPWLSPRTCDLLRDHDLNYLDGTGNVRLALDDPAVLVDRRGATDRPDDHDEIVLRRPKAVRLLRHLLEPSPRTRVKDLAIATQLSTGYASQLLTILERRGLISRGRRGRVEHLNLAGLLLQYAESYEAEAFTESRAYTTTYSLDAIVEQLRGGVFPAVVTGAFGALRLVRAEPPTTLTFYVEAPDVVASHLELQAMQPVHSLSRATTADVVLRRATAPFLLEGAWRSDGLSYASVPQLVADCFDAADDPTAERLLHWAVRHLALWRTPGWSPPHPSPIGR